MTLAWSQPQSPEQGETAYVHWWNAFNEAPEAYLPWDMGDLVGGSDAGNAADADYAGGQSVPIPAHARNPNPSKLLPFKTKDIRDKLPTDVPQDTVLVAVIDSGIALGHRRFRMAADPGRSRFVAAWQQTATWQGQGQGQAYLPFGQELYDADIKTQIASHTVGDPRTGWLDEDGFNRATGLTQPLLPDGQRDLDYHAAHGTHVADLASGYDPTQSPEADKARLIAINLPTQRIHGSAGHFLVYWALFAVERVLHIAKALWEANAANYGPVTAEGYPVVINFSYGMQAGPKDGTSRFERAVKRMLDDHAAAYRAPARLVMPVGNDNLDRCHARALMGQDPRWTGPDLRTELSVPWRVQPDDHTSNFAELWLSEPPGLISPAGPEAGKLTLSLTPPGHPRLDIPALEPGEYAELGGYARVYRRRPGDGEGLGYVFGVARTAWPGTGQTLAPAGLWSIGIRYAGLAANAALYIQSDQSGLLHSVTGRRSYFDHPRDQRFRPDGRARDSYDYQTGAATDDYDSYGPVQMRGTQSALVSVGPVMVIAGYREADGTPAPYSATLDEVGTRPLVIKHADAAFPSEDQPASFGIMAAGSKDGSLAALRGTSMASGLAARRVAEAMREWNGAAPDMTLADKTWLQDLAADGLSDDPNPVPDHYRHVGMSKQSPGRLPYPTSIQSGRLPRIWPRYDGEPSSAKA